MVQLNAGVPEIGMGSDLMGSACAASVAVGCRVDVQFLAVAVCIAGHGLFIGPPPPTSSSHDWFGYNPSDIMQL
jgi:hypothetical protein